MVKKIACIEDSSDHGGIIITSNQDGTFRIGPLGVFVIGNYGAGNYGGVTIPAVENALHSCPIVGHGITPITAITIKSYHNSKLILTEGAVAGCGAKLTPIDRKVNIE